MDLDNIGFCMGEFDIKVCHDCFSLKECSIMICMDRVQSYFKLVNESTLDSNTKYSLKLSFTRRILDLLIKIKGGNDNGISK